MIEIRTHKMKTSDDKFFVDLDKTLIGDDTALIAAAGAEIYFYPIYL